MENLWINQNNNIFIYNNKIYIIYHIDIIKKRLANLKIQACK